MNLNLFCQLAFEKELKTNHFWGNTKMEAGPRQGIVREGKIEMSRNLIVLVFMFPKLLFLKDLLKPWIAEFSNYSRKAVSGIPVLEPTDKVSGKDVFSDLSKMGYYLCNLEISERKDEACSWKIQLYYQKEKPDISRKLERVGKKLQVELENILSKNMSKLQSHGVKDKASWVNLTFLNFSRWIPLFDKKGKPLMTTGYKGKKIPLVPDWNLSLEYGKALLRLKNG